MKHLATRLWTTQTRIGLLVAAATIMLLLFAWANNLFAQSQLRLNDLFFVPHPVSDTIAIVALDDATHAAYGRSLAAWPRTVYADLITFLNQAQTRVVAFDVLFDQPTDDDQAVVEALIQARQNDVRTRFIMPQVGADQVETPTHDIPALNFYTSISPIPAFADVVDYLGYVNAFTDVDSIVRRQISLVESQGTPQISFDIATYLAYLRIPSSAAEQVIKPTSGHLQVASINIPVDENGLWQQNYFGGPANATQQTFPVYSALDVINGSIPQDVFDDKVVLVGLMNTTAGTDLYPVPSSTNGQLMSGVEIHANAIESLLQDKIPSFQSRVEQVIMIISLALICSLIYAHLKWYWMLPAAALMTTVITLVASVRFTNGLQFTNIFYGVLAVIIPLVANLFADIAVEIRRSTKAEFLLRSANDVSSQRMVMDRILPSLAGDIQRVLMTHIGAIWLTSEDQQTSVLRHSWGDCQTYMPILQALVIHVQQENRRVRKDGFAAVPVIWQKRLIAIIAVQVPSTRDFLQMNYRMRLLNALAEQVAPNLDNAALYTRTQEQNTLLEAVLGGSPAGIMVLEPDLTLIKMNKEITNALTEAVGINIGIPFITLLARAGIDAETQEAIRQEFIHSDYFRKEVKIGKKVFNLDVAKLDFGDWVVMLNDITALAEVSRLKTQMVRMTSHDLKKPLSRVLGYGSLLLDDPENESLNVQQRQYLQRMFHAGEEMLKLINDILDLEQLRSSHIKTKLVSVSTVLQEVLNRFLSEIEGKRQTLLQEIPETLPDVVGDPLLLSQALSNLIENAVKYTPEAGKITTRICLQNTYLRIEIEDTGFGISESAQAQLFQEFYRVRTRDTAHISGTGLGLSLVRSIAEAHNGRVGVKSLEGVGSTFFIELPTPQET